MFDIGFQEIVLIGLIGLVVVGPARLPKLAKTVGLYVNKMRRFVTDVRTDVERELHAEDLRQSLSGNGEFDELKSAFTEARSSLDEVRSTVDKAREDLSQASTAPSDWSNPDAGPAKDDAVAEPALTATDPQAADTDTDAAVDLTDAGSGEEHTNRHADAVAEVASVTEVDAVAKVDAVAEVEPGAQVNAVKDLPSTGADHGSAAQSDPDDGDDEVTVFNAKLAAKREAGAKTD